MSRIGRLPITVPAGVDVKIGADNEVTVKGPKGTLSTEINQNITVTIKDNELTLTRSNDEFKNFHGTANANITNMITGVTEGFTKGLESIGVGYRFNLKGNTLVVTAGYSHPVEVVIPNGIKAECPSNTELVLTSADKQLLGEFAANVRKIRQPEPYKGKGIRYKDEVVRRKEGKKASK